MKLKPWMNDNIAKRITLRNKLMKQLKKETSNTHLKEYCVHFRNNLREDIRKLKNEYYYNLFEEAKGNSKKTWRILNEITGQKRKNDNIDKLEIDNVIINDPLTKANEFNNYFLSVVDTLVKQNDGKCDLSSLEYKHLFKADSVFRSIFLFPVLECDVVKVVESLKNGTAPGLDGISTIILKKIYRKILRVLVYVINMSFESGVFPDSLKEAVVIPIYKKNSRKECCNYRPISLLSSLSKVVERLMKIRLLQFLEHTSFFSENQFGFRKGKNTETALVNFMERVSYGINNGMCVSGLFLDIAKAFDTVEHDILLSKLYKCGVRGVAYNWFKTYLKGRKQCVRVNGVLSQFGEIKYGVPQGSVLGATLFLIYINDLCKARLHGCITSFADDTALSYVGKTWDDISVKINLDLEAIQWWFYTNKMVLSASKTNYVNFSLRCDVIFNNRIVYKCPRCIIERTVCEVGCADVLREDSVKYLGVILDKELNWKKHIAFLRIKLGNIIRVFYFMKNMCRKEILRGVYFALIHSRLNYGIECWGGTYTSNIKSLVTLQKHAVRLITGKSRTEASWPLFQSLKVLPIRNMYIYKVLKIFYIRSASYEAKNEYKTRLRNAKDFNLPRPTCTYFTKWYSYLAPKIFNKLPSEIRTLNNIISFSKKVRIWLLTIQNADSLLTGIYE